MRHHYIPQFMLRGWSTTTADGKVETFRLDLPRCPSSRRVPKSIGYVENLYALTVDRIGSMEKHSIETTFLRAIDNDAARVLQKLMGSGLGSLSHDDRCAWVRFLMSLRLRHPEILQSIRLDAANMLKGKLDEQPEEYEALAGEADPPTLQEWTEARYPGLIENHGMTFFPELVENEKVANKLLRMKWWLWNFQNCRHELILADNPCIYTKGIDDPEVVIALPLGPSHAFMASRTERVAQIMRNQVPNDLLVRMNESSLNQAGARVYARNKAPKRFISNRARQRTH